MYRYPEEIRDLEIKRKVRKMRWVVYLCGCRINNIFIVPKECSTHKKKIKMTGPMIPYGEPFPIDPRNLLRRE